MLLDKTKPYATILWLPDRAYNFIDHDNFEKFDIESLLIICYYSPGMYK